MTACLKSRRIEGAARNVYEQESDLFFEDLSGGIVDDDVFQPLLTSPNMLVKGSQAFLTEVALTAIAEATLGGPSDLDGGQNPIEHHHRLQACAW